jgi:glucuronate isomerase
LKRDEFKVRGILFRMNVKVVCTTDDPIDSLDHHNRIKNDAGFGVKVLPAFRPDRAMEVENAQGFSEWVSKLEEVCGAEIKEYDNFIEALKKRHDFFHHMGCRLSDHGLPHPYAEEYLRSEIIYIFHKVRIGKSLEPEEILKFKSAMMYELAKMNHARGWTMQLHLGALRNTNTRFGKILGRDAGFDSIGDFQVAVPLARFLDRLDAEGKLPKTILYCVNPRDNDVLASMAGNFQDGSIAGKMQFGSAWWFNDQKDGIEKQIDALSNIGLLSLFVGMLTDSRSFLSYPRHEYFRRVLCNMIGRDVENGELPNDESLLGGMIQDISYNNAVRYFGINVK